MLLLVTAYNFTDITCTTLSIIIAITVSLKAAGYKIALIKKLQLVLSGDTFRPGTLETLSDPTPPTTEPVSHSGGEEVVREGPLLELGEDYSKGRKDDYPTVTNDE